MPTTTIVLILGAILFSVAGQLLLKSGTQHLVHLGRLEFVLAAMRDIRVLSGLAAWIAWMICWLYVLRVARLGLHVRGRTRRAAATRQRRHQRAAREQGDTLRRPVPDGVAAKAL